MTNKRLLILSDGKPGHVNQSIAFARHLGYEYDLSMVSYKHKLGKICSYVLDRAGIYSAYLFNTEIQKGEYTAVVSAGSGTYYPCRTLAKQLQCKSVAIMQPKGYRLDFDLIIAQQHDNPPQHSNIVVLPINLTYVEPQGLVQPEVGEKYIALIIGGDSHNIQMNPFILKEQLSRIFSLFPEHKVWLTTSRRTSKAVNEMLREFSYDLAVYYSREGINPIPDYLQHCEYVFLTADSSSMISEAVSFGESSVEVLPLSENSSGRNKFNKLIKTLSDLSCLHLFDGKVGNASKKINLTEALRGVQL